MRKPVNSAKRPASPWAVMLLCLSSGFAAAAVALLSTGYAPG
jgi:hypothetical protein